MEHQKDPKKQRQDTDDQPIDPCIAQINCTLDEQETSTENNRPDTQHDKSESFLRFWMPHIIQTVIAVAAVVTLIVVYFQTKNLLAQTELLKNQIINDHRAWVTLKESEHTKIKEGEVVTSTLIFVNTGRSPAMNLTINSNIMFRNTPIPTPMPLTIPSGQPRSKAVVGPQCIFVNEKFTNEKVTKERINDLRTSKEQLYAWGLIEYDDIFGQHRVTGYCLVAQPDTLSFNSCWNNNFAY